MESGLGRRVSMVEALLHDFGRAFGSVVVGPLPPSTDGMPDQLRQLTKQLRAVQVFETMACGTPVMASRIWGTPEVAANDTVGRLVSEHNGKAFAKAISQLVASDIKRESVRACAQSFGWQHTTNVQLALFGRLSEQQD